jgi:hypothetical protein
VSGQPFAFPARLSFPSKVIYLVPQKLFHIKQARGNPTKLNLTDRITELREAVSFYGIGWSGERVDSLSNPPQLTPIKSWNGQRGPFLS